MNYQFGIGMAQKFLQQIRETETPTDEDSLEILKDQIEEAIRIMQSRQQPRML